MDKANLLIRTHRLKDFICSENFKTLKAGTIIVADDFDHPIILTDDSNLICQDGFEKWNIDDPPQQNDSSDLEFSMKFLCYAIAQYGCFNIAWYQYDPDTREKILRVFITYSKTKENFIQVAKAIFDYVEGSRYNPSAEYDVGDIVNMTADDVNGLSNADQWIKLTNTTIIKYGRPYKYQKMIYLGSNVGRW